MSSAVRRHPRTFTEEGRPGREVVSLAVALLLTTAALDLLLSAGLGLFFDLVFVTVSADVIRTVASSPRNV